MGCEYSKDSPRTSFSIALSHDPILKEETAVYRNPKYINHLVYTIKRWPEERTVQQIYLRCFNEHSKKPCLGKREYLSDGTKGKYIFKTYEEVSKISFSVGAALASLNFAPEVPGEYLNTTIRCVGVYSKNREEVIELEIGTCIYGILLIALYDPIDDEVGNYICCQTGFKTLFTSKENLEKILEARREGKYTTLETIVCFDKLTYYEREQVEKEQLRILDWQTFLEYGNKPPSVPTTYENDLYTIAYTSGTTGQPKGAKILNSQVISFLGAADENDSTGIKQINENDSYLSYISFAHTFERANILLLLTRGAKIGFYSGEVGQMADDIHELKPTIFFGLPKIYNRFYNIIQTAFQKVNGMQKFLVKNGLESKLTSLKESNTYTNTIYDSLLFNKTKDALGGEVKLAISAGAPLSAEVSDLLKVAFCCPLLESYGMTETFSCCFLQKGDNGLGGNVGSPLGNIEFKLVDIPKLNLTRDDLDSQGRHAPSGELCLRGPGLFDGYFKEHAYTSKVFRDGWFHTGDIGTILPDGALQIIGRKSSVVKLAHGDILVPEKVETVYLGSKYVSEVYVEGSPNEIYCVAVVVPDHSKILELAKELKIEGTIEELCEDYMIKLKVLEDMNEVAKKAELLVHERAQKIFLDPNSFVSQGLVTPDLKLNRVEIRLYYKEIISEMYAFVTND